MSNIEEKKAVTEITPQENPSPAAEPEKEEKSGGEESSAKTAEAKGAESKGDSPAEESKEEEAPEKEEAPVEVEEEAPEKESTSPEEATEHSNARYRFNLALQGLSAILLGLIALGLVLIIANNRDWSYDLTAQKIYSLSPFSEQVACEIKEPIQFLCFISDGDDGRRREIREVVDNYIKLNPKQLSCKFIDPRKNPLEAQKHGVRSVGDIIVLCGERQERLYDVSEEGVTSLLISLTSKEKSTIHFLTGHGERGFEQTNLSLSKLKKSLLAEGYDVQELSLTRAQAMPQEVRNLAIVAPKLELLDKEKKMLEGWLREGGNLFLALELETPKGYDWLLKEYGLSSPEEIMLDVKLAQSGAEPILVLTNVYNQGSPITRGMTVSMGCFFKTARPVDKLSDKIPPTLNILPLVSSDVATIACKLSDLGKLNQQLTPTRQGQQMPIIQTVERTLDAPPQKVTDAKGQTPKDEEVLKVKKSRAVIAGDADFMSNELFDNAQAVNKDLTMNIFSWLGGSDAAVPVRAKDTSSEPLIVSGRVWQILGLMLCLIIPALIFFFGLAIVKSRG